MSDRRRKIDLGGYEGSSKRKKEEVNPWTGQNFSQRYYNILEKRTKLPVYQFKDELVAKVLENQSVVVEGETGSGKTTQVRARN
jgi:HrpA-like RNA helicase